LKHDNTFIIDYVKLGYTVLLNLSKSEKTQLLALRLFNFLLHLD